jgi:hypothetical protein
MLLAISSQVLTVGLATAYVGTGIGVATALTRRGRDTSTAMSALVAWPLLLSLLSASAPTPTRGPNAQRIAQAFAALEQALADPAAGPVPWSADLSGLREALARADARMGLVDRLLSDSHDTDEEVARSMAQLIDARAHAEAEIDAVLSGVAQLRLHIGLAALAGDGASVGDRLRELRARMTALDELSQLT